MPGGDGWQLTPAGLAAAAELRRARPPIYYWYREYYTSAPRSPAYIRFCEQLYGKYLCQANFSDMDQLARLAEVLALQPGRARARPGLRAGPDRRASCGYDRRGLQRDRLLPGGDRPGPGTHRRRRDRLDFAVQNLDTLDFPHGRFDALVSIDTLYMPNDLDATLRKMAALLKPGGRMGIFYSTFLGDVGGDRARLASRRVPRWARPWRGSGCPFKAGISARRPTVTCSASTRSAPACARPSAAEGRLGLLRLHPGRIGRQQRPLRPRDLCDHPLPLSGGPTPGPSLAARGVRADRVNFCGGEPP